MSYQTYTTEAIVCGTFNRNTADRSYLLFTKEAGMLYAEARSVREERSRQRMALQDFSLVRASLIKGKHSWKIGSIEPHTNFFSAATSKEARGSVVTLVKFLRRFFGEQAPAPSLFDYMVTALKQLSSELPEREFCERAIEVHLLHELGYADTRVVPPFVQSESLVAIETHASQEAKLRLERIIKQAVSTSHL